MQMSVLDKHVQTNKKYLRHIAKLVGLIGRNKKHKRGEGADGKSTRGGRSLDPLSPKVDQTPALSVLGGSHMVLLVPKRDMSHIFYHPRGGI